jgi:hypothetical protein
MHLMRPNMKRGAKSEWEKRLVSISANAILRRRKRPSPNPQIRARSRVSQLPIVPLGMGS